MATHLAAPGDPQPTARMAGLDGLRGLLVPIILLYHLGIGGYGGFLALEGFFVLSGFLITLLLLDRPPGSAHDLGRWWLRRWRRLVPAVVVVVTATVVAFRDLPGVTTDALSTLTWWRNWQMAFGATSYWSTTPSPLKHAWSLSVEEQFYLLFPLLIVVLLWVARRRGWTPSAVVAAACGALAVAGAAWQFHLGGIGDDLNRVYLGTDTRAGSILLGCAAGAIVHRSATRRAPASLPVSILGAVGLAVAVGAGLFFAIEDRATYRGGLVLASIGWVAATVAASRPGPVASLLSLRGLRWMGVRSYGIYLWSWPVQVYVETRWPSLATPAVALVTVVVSFALGALSLRLVEQPLRERIGWAAPTASRRLAWTTGSVAAVVAIAVVAATATPASERAMTEESTSRDAMASVEALLDATKGVDTSTSVAPTTAAPAAGDPATPVPPDVTSPAPPAPSSPTAPATTAAPRPPMTVVVGGDSQGFTLARDVGRRQLPDYIGAVANAAVLGCGVLVRTPGWMVDNPLLGGLVDGSFCRGPRSSEAAEVLALSANPDWLVITSGGYEQSHRYRTPDGRMLAAHDPEIRRAVATQLGVRIARANQHGTRVALLEFACPGRQPGEVGWDEFTRESIEWHNSNLREIAAANPGTITIPPSDQVCVGGDAAGSPTTEKARAWGTEDKVHVTDRGRAWVWNVQIGPALWAASVTS